MERAIRGLLGYVVEAGDHELLHFERVNAANKRPIAVKTGAAHLILEGGSSARCGYFFMMIMLS